MNVSSVKQYYGMKKELKNQGCPLNREFLYCMEGQVLLPLFKMPPSLLEELLSPMGGQC